MGFSRQEYWGGLPCPPPGNLPNPGIEASSLCLLHWQADSLPLAPPKWRSEVKSLSRVRLCDPMDCSRPGSSVHGCFQAWLLEWVAISFSKGSSWPRDWTRVSRNVGRRFTVWATREPLAPPTEIATVQCSVQFSSVQSLSRSDSLRPHESQHARPPCPSPTPGVYPNPCPSSPWCHPAISFSVVPFSSCPQSLPALGSFPTSQLFTWGGQSTGVSASASVLPMNTQNWSPSGWTGWISLQS